MPLQTLQATRLDWPMDWPRRFGREASMLLEIGFGGGHFLLDLAAQRLDANIMGIEVSLPAIRRAEQKLKTAVFHHVQLIQGSAHTVLWTGCAPAIFDEVYVNFPDPWPKHPQRRVINDTFLHLLASRMGENGRLTIATDHADYAEWITDCLERTPYFTSRLPTSFVTEDNERLRTKYEQFAIADGRTCHYYHWQRNKTAVANLFHPPKERPMPHTILRTPLTLSEISGRFNKPYASEGGYTVRLIEIFQSPHYPALLIDTYISEPALNQHVALSIHQRDDGTMIVGLREIGFPRPTNGVHFAIHAVTQWLLGLHPDTVLVKSNLNFDDT